MHGLYEYFRKFSFVYEIKSTNERDENLSNGNLLSSLHWCRVPLRGEIHSTSNIISLLRLDKAVSCSGLKTGAKTIMD